MNATRQRRAGLVLQILALSFGICLVATSPPNVFTVLGLLLALGTTWLVSTGLNLCTYLAGSGAPLAELLPKAAQASVPSLWLVPVYLLLSTLSTGWVALAVLLAANATRLLLARRLTQRPAKRRKTRASGEALFRPTPTSLSALPVILGAVILEVSFTAIVTGHPLAALGFACGASSLWTTSAILRGDYPLPDQTSHWPHAAWALLLSLILVTAMPEPGGGWGPLPAGLRILTGTIPHPEASPQPATTTVAEARKRMIPVTNGVPGVILRPRRPQPAKIMVPPPRPRPPLALRQPLRFAFTGEYRLYPRSSQRVDFRAALIPGTPMDAAYMTLAGGAMVTEAIQELYPPLDFTGCAKIEVTLLSGEGTLAVATLQLLGPGGEREVGSDIFGMRPVGNEEMLEFPVPAPARGFVAHAIRLTFQHSPAAKHISSKISIRGFALLPRD